jgi:hypothetical protein
MRTIENNMTQEQTEQPGVKKALDYLYHWAFDAYDKVQIFMEGKEDFVACYSDSKDEAKKYVIGAVNRGGDEFSFHS